MKSKTGQASDCRVNTGKASDVRMMKLRIIRYQQGKPFASNSTPIQLISHQQDGMLLSCALQLPNGLAQLFIHEQWHAGTLTKTADGYRFAFHHPQWIRHITYTYTPRFHAQCQDTFTIKG